MRTLTIVGAILVILGIAGLVASIAMGYATLAIVVIIPVILIEGVLPVVSIVTLIGGFVVLSFSALQGGGRTKTVKGKRTWGGVVFIGPFPIIFGNMKGAIPLWITIAISVIASMLLMLTVAALLYGLF